MKNLRAITYLSSSSSFSIVSVSVFVSSVIFLVPVLASLCTRGNHTTVTPPEALFSGHIILYDFLLAFATRTVHKFNPMTEKNILTLPGGSSKQNEQEQMLLGGPALYI